MKFEKELHNQFVKQINRLVDNHGELGLQLMRLDTHGLYVQRTLSIFSVVLDGKLLVTYTDCHPFDQTYWVSDREIRAAMREIGARFVLDELADV